MSTNDLTKWKGLRIQKNRWWECHPLAQRYVSTCLNDLWHNWMSPAAKKHLQHPSVTQCPHLKWTTWWAWPVSGCRSWNGGWHFDSVAWMTWDIPSPLSHGTGLFDNPWCIQPSITYSTFKKLGHWQFFSRKIRTWKDNSVFRGRSFESNVQVEVVPVAQAKSGDCWTGHRRVQDHRAMEVERSLNRVALWCTNDLVMEKEEALVTLKGRLSATVLYLEE